MIEKGRYFTINRPRQYGKTTTLYLLAGLLGQNPDYLVFRISFEGIDLPTYEKHENFIKAFLKLLKNRIQFLPKKELAVLIDENLNKINTMGELSEFITGFIKAAGRKVVLMIDEVDKSKSNKFKNQRRDEHACT